MATKKSNFNVQTTFTAKDKNLIKTYNNIDKRARALQKTMGSVKTAMATVVGGVVVKNLADMSGQIDRAIVNFDKLAMADQGLKKNMFLTIQDSVKDMNMSLDESVELIDKLSKSNFNNLEAGLAAAKGIDKTLMIMGSNNKGGDSLALLEAMGAVLKQNKNDPEEITKFLSNIAGASMAGTFTASDLIETIKYSATTALDSGMSQEDYFSVLAGLSEIGVKGSTAGTMLSNIIGSSQKISSDRDLQANLNAMGLNTRDNEGNLVSPMELQKRIFDLFQSKGFSAEQRMQFLDKVFGATGADAMKDFFNKSPEEFAKLSQAIEKFTQSGEMDVMANYYQQQLGSQLDLIKNRFKQIGVGLLAEGSPLSNALKLLATQVNNLLDAVLSDEGVGKLMEQVQKDLAEIFGNITVPEDLLLDIYNELKSFIKTLKDVYEVLKSIAGFTVDAAKSTKDFIDNPVATMQKASIGAIKKGIDFGKDLLGLKNQDASTITPNVNVNSNFDIDNDAIRDIRNKMDKNVPTIPNLMSTGFAQ